MAPGWQSAIFVTSPSSRLSKKVNGKNLSKEGKAGTQTINRFGVILIFLLAVKLTMQVRAFI